MDEQRLKRALRQGPPFATPYVPSSLALEEQPAVGGSISLRRVAMILALAGLLIAGMVAGSLAMGLVRRDVRPVSNGWIAFTRFGSGPTGPDGWTGRDIYLVREGETANRIVGSDSDGLDQICPAFSADGRRLAYGEAHGTPDAAYRDAALVIADIDAAGNASESRRIPVGGTFAPPCAVWSADGRRVAFGVGHASRGYNRPAVDDAVWVATVSDGKVKMLPGLPVTALKWSPADSTLAIARGAVDPAGKALGDGPDRLDGSISLYDANTGAMRTLVGPGPWGVWSLTWAPDGRRIAYQRGGSDSGATDQQILAVQVDGSGESVLERGFRAIYGVGPVWSPTGDRIVYQRWTGGEAHDVVLVAPDGATKKVVVPGVRLPGTDPKVTWRPDSITWSPDGKELLYSAWSHGEEPRERRNLIAVPLGGASNPVVLVEGVETAGENRSWGRLPD